MSAPFLEAWEAGGCVICGGPDRGSDANYAHNRCVTGGHGAWFDACDAYRDRWAEVGPQLLAALKAIDPFLPTLDAGPVRLAAHAQAAGLVRAAIAAAEARS